MANEKRLIDANELAKEYQFTEDHTSPSTPWTITDILDILDEAPTVDAVEVVHGRWLWHDDEFEYVCSACKCRFDYNHTFGIFDHDYEYGNYCPNCGTKMDGDGNG